MSKKNNTESRTPSEEINITDINENETAAETAEAEKEEPEEKEYLSGKERRRRRRRNRKKKSIRKPGKKFYFITGGILGGLILIYLGISAYFIGHFYINTTINGKDFSGKTKAAVENYIKQQVDGYELTIVEQNNDRNTIRGSEIGLKYKESSDIEDVMNSQNPFLWPAGFFTR